MTARNGLARWLDSIDVQEEEPPASLPSWMAPGGKSGVTPRRPSAMPPAEWASVSTGHASPAKTTTASVAAMTSIDQLPAFHNNVAADASDTIHSLARETELETALSTAHGELDALRAGLAATVTEMARHRGEVMRASERDLVELAIAIAQRVVGRELRTNPALILQWAREGMEALVDRDDVEVALSMEMEPLVPNEARTELGCSVVVDPLLPPGSCEVRGRFARVDQGVTARLDAVCASIVDEEDA